MYRIFVFVFSLSAATKLLAQSTNSVVELDSITIQNNRWFEQSYALAREFAAKNNLPMTYSDQFRTVSLVGIDDGIPIYLSTDNIEAAVTTGVIKLRGVNSLGLNLEGNGMRVGVWDGGKVAHIEFENRILSTEGANNDNHATHVTGTIAAAGINPDIKGMAPKAKVISFDFNNALSEMASLAKPDQTSIILSNHSYGFVTGWDCTVSPCQWRGNPSVSAQEDFRFGFYSNNTREWDRIANNAPYYLMVKSAGNDRSDRGPNGAIYPTDGNGGTGYDCIEEQATAKNILTVGAVNPVLNYTDASSVVMSSFSSWGPTDDGRIKPDLVADGVGLLSTTLNNGYGRLSGTSMSSPNVTGSLTLIQELHRKLNGGNFMLSSTLKALSVHTAREAGISPGPDYSFGWGLLDVDAAARLLLNKDNRNIFVREQSLRNGETFNLALTPKANTKITVTIAWNDPAGTPVANSLDPPNLMLVNDLDIRLLDGQTVAQFPWTLNPEVNALGQAAFKGDNFRDNIEKIEFENPEEKVYTVTVSHKGTLRGNAQVFSLIVSYTSIATQPETLYWIGESGGWNDPNHWSLTSGGVPANRIPSAATKLIIDENSFSSDGQIDFFSNASCQSLLAVTSKERVALNLNGNTLNINGDLLVGDSTFVSNSVGTISFAGSTSFPNNISLFKSRLSSIKFLFDGNAFVLNGNGSIGEIALVKGLLDMKGSNLAVNELNASGSASKTLVMSNATISNLSRSNLSVSSSLAIVADSVQISTGSGGSVFNWDKVNFNGKLSVNSSHFELNGNSSLLRLFVAGSARLNGDNQISELVVLGGSTLMMAPSSTQTLSSKVLMQSNSTDRIKLQATEPAFLRFDGKYRVCFDYLDISKVTVLGTASINAGLNSTLTDAQNWFQDECQNVIVPDFDVGFGCVGAKSQLNDKSIGLITSYLWEISPSAIALENKTEKSATATFQSATPYVITLTVSNQKFVKSIQKTINVRVNDLSENQISVNGLNLFSREPGSSYQWFRDNQVLNGATGRSFSFNGIPGIYNVITYSENCNRQSSPLVITSAHQPQEDTFAVYPNPASSKIFVTGISSDSFIKVFDLLGKVIAKQNAADLVDGYLDISHIPVGTYIIEVENEHQKRQSIIVINR